jgi:hypothetical protein
MDFVESNLISVDNVMLINKKKNKTDGYRKRRRRRSSSLRNASMNLQRVMFSFRNAVILSTQFKMQ